jgi:hypothetical protein
MGIFDSDTKNNINAATLASKEASVKFGNLCENKMSPVFKKITDEQLIEKTVKFEESVTIAADASVGLMNVIQAATIILTVVYATGHSIFIYKQLNSNA